MHILLHLIVTGVVGLFVFLLCVIGLSVLFAPLAIAHFRKTRRRWLITVMTVLFGWVPIAWFCLLVWAWTDAPVVDPGPLCA